MKKIGHVFEAITAKILLAVFGAMKVETASYIGGRIGKFIGPKLKVNKTARRNIKLAMPELSEERVNEILLGMWDNLGRIMTEYSHLTKMTDQKIDEVIEVEGQENLDAFIKDKSSFLITGHFGNWEMFMAVPYRQGGNLHVVYRKANNPYIDKMILQMRERYKFSTSAKGSVGARKIIKALKDGKHVAMLVDQKQNDGIAVPFFDVPAMTAPGVATLTLKYDCNIYPCRIVRVGGAKFKFIVYPRIPIIKTGDEEKDTLNLMTSINSILEDWIRENPEQWFWVHNRWPKDVFKNMV